ncbi:MAG TPA: 4-hydroxythreonine-4-phosphate dehydrogenase PdxA [Aliidongia sp.]|uniref:4-hydroxythreonine-4-phosphate dehydrogenase PdxA n=1 Tax=Aliidongia sp. TaxID=1914230 RepID=UPI002DDD007D|nr:4-hydroxythreonine-4-phosphate dehydrogenase PdxA [Aliidongia sp.]HEV2674954.1 4-hydroxythreonine-4-phosphate dehydrogenase PdxA [Aliidongia sp.]
MSASTRPVVALTLGDASGIGPELVAKLLSRPDVVAAARIVLVGDPWVWAEGQRVANLTPTVRPIENWAAAKTGGDDLPMFLATDTVAQADIVPGRMTAAAGRGARAALTLCLDAFTRHDIDAICFAPLNKQALKKGGMAFEDELHFFADHLGVTSYFCEFNTLGTLWTSRISSHVPLAQVTTLITKDRIKAAAKLTGETLRRAGFANPRIGLAALNPHGGDGGTCGREEIDIIEPAARELNAEGVPILGPYPADTIFLKARDGLLDAVVTMYHDQGQVAIKLLGFEKGVTVQGGLPVPITTPAHGTAFDIVGANKANVEATAQAFLLAARLGASYRAGSGIAA